MTYNLLIEIIKNYYEKRGSSDPHFGGELN